MRAERLQASPAHTGSPLHAARHPSTSCACRCLSVAAPVSSTRPGGHGAPLSSLHRYPNEDTGDHRNVATASGWRYASASRSLGSAAFRPRSLGAGACVCREGRVELLEVDAVALDVARARHPLASLPYTDVAHRAQRPRMMCVRARPMRTPNGSAKSERSAIDPRARPQWARPIADAR